MDQCLQLFEHFAGQPMLASYCLLMPRYGLVSPPNISRYVSWEECHLGRVRRCLGLQQSRSVSDLADFNVMPDKVNAPLAG